MNQTLTDTDTVILDALDFEPQCESGRHEGDHAATWGVTLGCGHLILLCHQAKDHALEVRARGDFALCPACLEATVPLAVTPLGRA